MSILLSSLLFFACQSEIDNQPSAEVKPMVEAKKSVEKKSEVKKEAPTGVALSLKDDSSIGFVGAKITGDHSGEFKKFSGTASVADGKLTGLKATVDMSSVEADNVKLTSHLLSPDFFDVGSFAEATFTSSKIEDGKISGVLDFHGIKNKISFPADIKVEGENVKINAKFNINRQLWKISYPGKKDDLIKDDVLIKINANYGK